MTTLLILRCERQRASGARIAGVQGARHQPSRSCHNAVSKGRSERAWEGSDRDAGLFS